MGGVYLITAMTAIVVKVTEMSHTVDVTIIVAVY